jgi:hypothetical protein
MAVMAQDLQVTFLKDELGMSAALKHMVNLGVLDLLTTAVTVTGVADIPAAPSDVLLEKAFSKADPAVVFELELRWRAMLFW